MTSPLETAVTEMQQGLASDASDRLANALAMFGSVNNRVGGINPS